MMFYSTKKLTGAGLFALVAGLACHGAYAQDDEKADPSPFPPGKNAMLVKQTCSQCHTPNVVLDQTFDEKTAGKIYRRCWGRARIRSGEEDCRVFDIYGR
jgi:hypothetical protein